MLKTAILLIAMIAGCTWLRADETMLITIMDNQGTIPLTIVNAQQTRKQGNIYHPAHFKDHGRYAIMRVQPINFQHWTTGTFYFKPEKDGELTIRLQGKYVSKGDDPWCVVKDVTIMENTSEPHTPNLLKQASFIESQKGLPQAWEIKKMPYMTGDGVAISFSSCLQQTFTVKANRILKLVITAKSIL